MPDPTPPRSPRRRRPGRGGGGGRKRPLDLKGFLSGKSKPAAAMSYHELQGFLFAISSAPDVVPPSEWMPLVFGADEPPFESEPEAQRILGDLFELYNRINSGINEERVALPPDCRFREDVMSNFAADAPMRGWSRGFVRGHAWLEESWDAHVPESLNEDIGPLLMTLSFFASRGAAERFHAKGSDGSKSLAEMAEMCREIFPEIMATYAQLGRSYQEEVAARPPAPAASHKVGRNDPCPCGSGKKYKKCCQSGPVDLMQEAARDVRRAQDEVEPRVIRFLRALAGEDGIELAWKEFACGYDSFEGERSAQELFGPWVLYAWAPPDADGKPDPRPAAQRYVDEHANQLTARQVDFLRRTWETPVSFHEVLEVEPGRRLRLRDILLGTEHEVFEQSGSRQLRFGDVIHARVVAYDKVALIIGMGETALPPIEKQVLIRARKLMSEKLGKLTSATLFGEAKLLREAYLGIRERLINPAPPVMNNTDNEPIEFHTLTCDVESAGEAFEALAPLNRGTKKEELLRDATFDEEGRLEAIEFAWLKKKKLGAAEYTGLARIEIDGTKLTAEVNSAKRAQRLHKELRKRLGGSMRNLTVVIKPIEEAMAEYESTRDTPEQQARRAEEAEWRQQPEVRQAMREFLERTWEGWLDEKIPALEGLTPREAVRRPDTREMVEALLLQFERDHDAEEQGAYDFNRLRRALGLQER